MDEQTRDAVIELVTASMCSGYVAVLHQQDDLRAHIMRGLSAGEAVRAVLGAFPADFVQTRSDLVDAVLTTNEKD